MRHTSRDAWERGAPPLRRAASGPPGPEKGAVQLPGWLDGLDVSEFQSSVDYLAVAGAGFRFVVVRASLGPGYVDRAAARHAQGFRTAGLRVLFYAALQPEKADPRGQVRRGFEGMGDAYARLLLDLETRGGLTNGELVDFLLVALDEVDAAGALDGGVYSYPWFEASLEPELGRAIVLSERPLWQAYQGGAQPWAPPWGASPRVPAPWDAAKMWQYSGGEPGAYRVPGVPGACDRDLFRGSLDDLDRFLGLPPPVDPAADTAPHIALDGVSYDVDLDE